MKLTKLETAILLEALKAYKNHHIAMLEDNMWKPIKDIKDAETQELKGRTVFKLNTLDSMVKSVKDGKDLLVEA